MTIGAGVVTSLLTLYALMRVWDAAFWRPKPAAEAAAPHASVAEPHEHLRAPEPAPVTVPETETEGRTGGPSDTGAPAAVVRAPAGDGSVATLDDPTRSDAHDHGDAPSTEHARSKLPPMLVVVTTVAVLGSVALTVLAGPLYGYATRAAESLESPDRYVQAVLGGEAR